MSSERIRPVTMPKWGIEMQEGTVTAWNHELGRRIDKGDALLDVETEKIVNSVESPASGTLRRILAQAGDTLAVGALLAVLAEPDVDGGRHRRLRARLQARSMPRSTGGEDAAATAPAPVAAAPAPAPAAVAARRAAAMATRTSARSPGGWPRNSASTWRRSPAPAAMAASRRKTSRPTRQSCRRQRLRPLQRTAPSAAGRPCPSSRERLTSMRFDDCAPAVRVEARDSALPAAGRPRPRCHGAAAAPRWSPRAQRVSINDLLLQAVARALSEHPRLNAQFTGEELLGYTQADLAVAVATPGGLITPCSASRRTCRSRRSRPTVRDLAERARAGRLTREEITGGTFTVSNLGMFGVRQFDAIINPPQVAILAVGALQARPVVRDGAIAVGQRMSVTLSSDHRVVDGADAAAFLATLSDIVANAAAGD